MMGDHSVQTNIVATDSKEGGSGNGRPRYRVIQRVNHDNVLLEAGAVFDPPGTDVQALLAVGAIAPVDEGAPAEVIAEPADVIAEPVGVRLVSPSTRR